MAQIPVSIGLPALVMRKRSHVVTMVDENRLELVRRIPYVVVLAALVVANLAFVGAGPFAGLRSDFGYATLADSTLFVLALSMLVIGRPVRLAGDRLAEARLVFLPEWTGAMLLSVAAGIALLLT